MSTIPISWACWYLTEIEGIDWRDMDYTAMKIVGAVVALLATRTRTDFEATVLRLPGAPYSVEDGQLRNALQIHVVNKRADAQTYRVEVNAPPPMTAVIPMATLSVDPMGSVRVPLFLSMPRDAFAGEFPVTIRVVEAAGSAGVKTMTPTFLGPSR